MQKNASKIPAFVTFWADRYFHQSAWDIPINYPNKKTINFLSQFRKFGKIKLFRGINNFNKDNEEITSWTYSKNIAKRYSSETDGKVIEKEFLREQILLDTTMLDSEQKRQLGYDYREDDSEVLILNPKR